MVGCRPRRVNFNCSIITTSFYPRIAVKSHNYQHRRNFSSKIETGRQRATIIDQIVKIKPGIQANDLKRLSLPTLRTILVAFERESIYQQQRVQKVYLENLLPNHKPDDIASYRGLPIQVVKLLILQLEKYVDDIKWLKIQAKRDYSDVPDEVFDDRED